MTWFHFANCIALALGPVYITYKGSALAEYRAFSACLVGFFGYISTQLLKMILIAILFPLQDSEPFQQEFGRAVLFAVDIIGNYITLSRLSKGTPREVRVLAAALGWSAAEIALANGPTLFGALSLEFEWTYIQRALESNLIILFYISLTRANQIFMRKNNTPTEQSLVIALVFACVIVHFAVGYSRVLMGGLASLIVFTVGSLSLFVVSSIISRYAKVE
ncbi:transmembrane protein [Planoprotostelium fungivorum]|uniref:BOS complex subunit TMEM147 n=1 Tax=Planoprotostelium fungivorum TaxID=1890364 RepID=A0A2P6NKN6_9EUKA|nr:transmembrane protein [Planoprotostelium fungivorum]